MFDYVDIHFTIHRPGLNLNDPLTYPLVIRSKVAGEQLGTFSPPFPEDEVARFLGMLDARIGSASRAILRETPERRRIEEFGKAYFEALLRTREVRTCYDRTWARIQEHEQLGLRVRLTCHDPRLMSFPWEILHDGARFLFVSSRVVLVRYLPQIEPIVPIAVTLPLRILVGIASPNGLPPVDVKKEIAMFQRSFSYLGSKVLVDIITGVNYRALQARLRNAQAKATPFHVLHYIGHGGYDKFSRIGYLAFESEEQNLQKCDGKRLGQLLTSYPTLRLAVLNACQTTQADRDKPYSGVAEALIKSGIPAVIAMQFPITDRTAIVFTGAFYEAVVDGLPIDAALGEARVAIYGDEDSLEFGTSVLYSRIEDGRVFNQDKLIDDKQSHAFSQIPPVQVSRIRVPSDDELMKDLLSSDLSHVQRAAKFIHGMDKTQVFQGRLLELFNGSITSFQQRIAIGRAFNFIGDPRDLEEMILIPAGRFWLGSHKEHIQAMIDQNYRYFSLDEVPLQRYFLPSFRITKYPVTNQQYLEFLRAMPGHPVPPGWDEGNFPPELANHPVVQVSWYDAVAYARWRGKRLPTEFEWEKAAKGLAKRQYPWGNEFDREKCNVQLEIVGTTTSVGVFLDGASCYGVLDMAGNVWEWTDSYYLPYPGNDGSEEKFGDIYRVVRGGSFHNPSSAARCACRLCVEPTEKNKNVGFRLAASIED